MFDGETFSGYVVGTVPHGAKQWLEQSDPPELLSRADDVLVRHLLRMFEIPEVEYDEEGSGFQEQPDGSVTLKIHVPGIDDPHASRYFALTPSHSRRIANAHFSRPYVVISGLPPAAAANAMESIKFNIDNLNKDINRGQPAMVEHLTNVVESHMRAVRTASALREQQMADLRSRLRPLPDPPTDAREGPTDLPGREPDAAVDDSEARLANAVAIITGTTAAATQLRALRIVRDVATRWGDFPDERKLFAGQILLGLDMLAEFIERGEPDSRRRTIVTNIKQNLDQAIRWANENQYARFAEHLLAASQVIQMMAS